MEETAACFHALGQEHGQKNYSGVNFLVCVVKLGREVLYKLLHQSQKLLLQS